MKRKILASAAFVLLVCCLFSCKNANVPLDTTADETTVLKDSTTAEDVVTTEPSGTDGSISTTEEDAYAEYVYDEKGLWQKKICYSPYTKEKTVICVISYEYDEKDRKIKETVEYADQNLAQNRYCTYKYDGNGNVLEEHWFFSDGSNMQRTTFSYDARNNMIEQKNYNIDGTCNGGTEYEYDERDNCIKQVAKDSDGSTYRVTTYEHDNSNNVIKTTVTNDDGSIYEVLEYGYDEKGNRIKITAYVSDELKLKYTEEYSFDEKGNVSKIVDYNEKGDITYVKEFYPEIGKEEKVTTYHYVEDVIETYSVALYEKNGYLISVTKYDIDGNIIEFEDYR